MINIFFILHYYFFQVKKTFHEPGWWDHHERWKDMRYRWLPTWEEVPKHLHENALLSHYEELEVCKCTYVCLQKSSEFASVFARILKNLMQPRLPKDPRNNVHKFVGANLQFDPKENRRI